MKMEIRILERDAHARTCPLGNRCLKRGEQTLDVIPSGLDGSWPLKEPLEGFPLLRVHSSMISSIAIKIKTLDIADMRPNFATAAHAV